METQEATKDRGIGDEPNNSTKCSEVADGVARQWLAGEDPVVQQQKHKQVPADYMDLFKPDAPWPTSASQLKVFKISTQMALHGTT
jgi:hypothetical protein